MDCNPAVENDIFLTEKGTYKFDNIAMKNEFLSGGITAYSQDIDDKKCANCNDYCNNDANELRYDGLLSIYKRCAVK